MENLKIKEFKTNPNIKFKQKLKVMSCCFGINDIFDIYYSIKDNNELYLISPDENYTISITRIRDNQLIKSLEPYEKNIRMVKHFFNEKDSKDYLIVTYLGSHLNIWNLTDNYKLIHSININYSTNSIIYGSLFYFPKNEGDYFLVSSNEANENDYTKIYDFRTGLFLENLEKTNIFEIFYLILWNNKNVDYLIECSNSNILIHNLVTKKLYRVLHNEKRTIHNSACIIKNAINSNDNLYVLNINGNIDIWDLENFNYISSIYLKSGYFYHIISWSNRYLFISEKFNSSIIIIDTKANKAISLYKNIHKTFVIGLKKIVHPLFGESLLSSDISNNIFLWTH